MRKLVSMPRAFLTLLLLHFSLPQSHSLPARDAPDGQRKIEKTCRTLDDNEGYCSFLYKCFTQEYSGNFSLAENHTCTIDHTYLGVCCGQNSKPVSADLTDEQTLAEILPAIAVEDGEVDGGEFVDSTRIHVEDGEQAKRNPRQSRGCGTTSKYRTRLVGGRPADPAEWPWMAALLRQGTGQYCGGVLITDRHVLTAAHCVSSYAPWEIKVRLGEYDFTREGETKILDFAVTEIRSHRDFDYTSYENDIAIVKIHRPTTFNNYIWPVCLPPILQSFENKSAIVTGWGTQYYGGPASTVLMEVSVPIWPQDKCEHSYTQRIPRTTMCAGAYEGGRDSCQGDSGGPLLHQLSNGRWVNVGIVSWGIRCGEPGRPGIYTRVSSYLDWIFANAVF